MQAHTDPPSRGARLARRIFLSAGIYGIIVLAPMYFTESLVARDYPPAITHPEHFYGFIGVALAWQVVFLIASRDPLRYRALMIPAVLEKFSYGIAAVVLYLQGRLTGMMLGFGFVDLVLGTLFGMCFVMTAVPKAKTSA